MYEDERVINIKDMLYRTCIHWRSICVTGIMFSVGLLLINLPILIQSIERHKNNIFREILFKYSGIGLAVGIVLAAFFYLVSYLVSDKVYLAEELGQRYPINLIGTIPRDTKKKRNVFDQLLNKMFGMKVSGEMQESLAERAAEEIFVLVSLKGKGWPDVPVISLVSSYSDEITAEFEMMVVKRLKKDVRLVNAGNILQDARSIRMAERADFVVLVEEQGRSSFKEYNEACRKLSLWKKDVLGVVFLV